MTPIKIGSYVVGVIFLIILLVGTFVLVPAGAVGIETRFGAVIGTMSPGLHFKMPFVESVTQMDVQTQKEQVDATAASNDLQDVTATVAVNFHVNPQDAANIFSNVGSDYQARVIDPAVQESIKSVTANYTAEQLITQREVVREKILALLSEKMQSYGVNVDSLNIVNFNFSSSFNQAVEAKVTAQQNALTAQNQVAQAIAQASSTVIAAQAQARAIEIQSQAIENSGGANYVALQEIKVEQAAIDKWDGKLPTQMIPGSSLPFLNLTATK